MQRRRAPSVSADGNVAFSIADPRTRQGTGATAAEKTSQTWRSPAKKRIRAPGADSNPLFHPIPAIRCPALDAAAAHPAEAARCVHAQICRSYIPADIQEILQLPPRKSADSAAPFASATRLSRFSSPSETLDPPQSSGRPAALPPQRVLCCDLATATAACAPVNPRFAPDSEKHSLPFHIRKAIVGNLKWFPDRALQVRWDLAPPIAVALGASIPESPQPAAPEQRLPE